MPEDFSTESECRPRSTRVKHVMSRIATEKKGLLLYGSRARDDYEASSGFDILRYTSSWKSRTFKSGRVSVSSYTREQLESASGTLFGTHHRRDGRVLVELGDDLTRLIENLQPADPAQLLARVTQCSTCQRQLNFDQLSAARWSVFSCRRHNNPGSTRQ